jgi:hypothetical protein
MKASIFLVFITLLMSCSKNDSDCNSIKFNNSFTAKGGEYYCLDDKNYISIDSVNICPCSSYCYWPYEYGLHMTIVSNGIENKEFVFATENTAKTSVFETFKMKFITINSLSCDDDVNDVRARFKLEKQ